MRRKLTGLAAAFMACAALAQPSPSDPDWRESDAPPPPALRTADLVPLEMPGSNNLKFGVDPDSVSIGSDSIVRYVVVASSATGAVNAMYEGIHCDKGESRVYARHTPGAGWALADTEWRSMHAGAARHTLTIARDGACIGQAPNGSAAQIVRDLKASPDRRFRPEAR
jgi:hypothetical protein